MREITVNAQTACLDEVLAFVEIECSHLDCSIRTSTQILIAVEELFINIVNYAYIGTTGYVHMLFVADNTNGEVTLVFTDDGVPYNPLDTPVPDTTSSAAKRQIGGLGVFLVKKIMTTLNYEYRNKQNVLTITKAF